MAEPLVGLTCQELVELVTDYLEGQLSASDSGRFEQHIATCPNCRTYLDQLRQTIGLLGRLSEESIEPRTRDELLKHFRAWKSG